MSDIQQKQRVNEKELGYIQRDLGKLEKRVEKSLMDAQELNLNVQLLTQQIGNYIENEQKEKEALRTEFQSYMDKTQIKSELLQELLVEVKEVHSEQGTLRAQIENGLVGAQTEMKALETDLDSKIIELENTIEANRKKAEIEVKRLADELDLLIDGAKINWVDMVGKGVRNVLESVFKYGVIALLSAGMFQFLKSSGFLQ